MATRRSTISNAVLNSQRAEQMEYGSNHSSPCQQKSMLPCDPHAGKYGLPGPPPYEAIPYQSPVSSSSQQRSRYGMSSGGGPSSINIFNHDGQGLYRNPYERPAGAVVAPQRSREERYRMHQSSRGVDSQATSGQPGACSTISASSPSGPTSRSRLGQAGSSCIMGQSPTSMADVVTPSKRRGSSWGGGDSSNVASILSWSTNVSTPPTSYQASSASGPSTSNDAYGYALSSTSSSPSPSPPSKPPAADSPPYMAPPPALRPSHRPTPGGRSTWTPGWT